MAALERVKVEDLGTQRFIDQAATVVNPVLANPLLNGRLIEGLILSAASGVNYVDHGLGRRLRGWFPVLADTGGNVLYDLQDTNPNPDKTLLLYTSLRNMVVSLWVF